MYLSGRVPTRSGSPRLARPPCRCAEDEALCRRSVTLGPRAPAEAERPLAPAQPHTPSLPPHQAGLTGAHSLLPSAAQPRGSLKYSPFLLWGPDGCGWEEQCRTRHHRLVVRVPEADRPIGSQSGKYKTRESQKLQPSEPRPAAPESGLSDLQMRSGLPATEVSRCVWTCPDLSQG